MSATLLMFSPRCAHCGETLPRSANFCVGCGKPFHISDEAEADRPLAPVRPLRTTEDATARPVRSIEDSVKLAPPPKTSSLSPFGAEESKNETSLDRSADSWDVSSPVEPSKTDRSAISQDLSDVSQDMSATSRDMAATTQDLSASSLDLEGNLLAPADKPKRWKIAAAVAGGIFLLFLIWPSSKPKTLPPELLPQNEEATIEEPTSASAPASLAAPTEVPASAPAPTAQPAKATEPKASAPQPTKTNVQPTIAPAPTPAPKGDGILGTLKAQEAADTAKPPAATPEPTPTPTETPKPKDNKAAEDEAAGFLDEN